jgi:DNA recombination protein RmuC
MEMLLLFLILAAVLALLVLTLVRATGTAAISEVMRKEMSPWMDQFRTLEAGLREEIRLSRQESANAARDNREEMSRSLREFADELRKNFLQVATGSAELRAEVEKRLETLTLRTDEKLGLFETQLRQDQEQNREAMIKAFDGFRTTFETNVKSFNDLQREKFGELLRQQQESSRTTELRMEGVRATVEEKLNILMEQARKESAEMRDNLQVRFREFGEDFGRNVEAFKALQKEKFDALDRRHQEMVRMTEQRLESMRVTVEEKLDKTLSERLGQSFETVGKQLAEVQSGLGEMRTIATDVGGLKKVLSNVKLRGGIGEVQLAMLLEQILAPGQYEAEVRLRPTSAEVVEFAIKLPGRDDEEEKPVYLPIDAKFPKEAFEKLVDAYELGSGEDIERESKAMELVIRNMAKDIHDKYIHPPFTTDFAIMFLPFESIYAEVIRRTSLVDRLRDEFRVVVAGPTTLAALLNSLQMGFRTLAIQKRSSEVWKVLAAVKSEFEKFGGILQKAQKNIQTGLGQLDDVVGPRTRAIQRRLKQVEALPAVGDTSYLSEVLPDPDALGDTVEE